MTHKAKVWLVSTLGLAGYLAAVTSFTRWLSLPDRRGLWLLVALTVLGVGAWLFTAIFLSKRQPAPPPPQDPLSLEMDAAITQTERRLIAARVARGGALHKLPAVFVVGPRQHHKTSAVIRSGVHAELLAGDVLRGVQVVPTQSINTWFAGQAVVAEVSVDVAQTPDRFARFLARFQPARLTNALASGVQAPRAVLVCYSCEALRQPGARDATLVAARELRNTLGTIAQSYGIRLPVYVLFTKADDLPGFKEFTRRFTADEARDVLGATLPLTSEVRAAEYADRASQTYRQELQTLFESLANRRVDVLAREDAADQRPRAYQFPRELRKLEPLLTDFLVELGRPSDLATSAFVRGFYFSGVREVFVGDDSGAAAIPTTTRVSEDAGATALLGALPRPDAVVASVKSSGRRREAQWVFLDRLLSQVVLNDAAALGVTRGGTRISFFRRAALGTVAAAAALLIVAQLTSFRLNGGLQRDVRRSVNAANGTLAASVPERLVTLDSLGNALDDLSDYSWDGVPLRLRLGLYQGDTLYGTAHAAYFRHFRNLLFTPTFETLGGRLRTLSDTAQSDAAFGTAYGRLKAYLTIADSTTLATEELANVMLANWPAAASLDTAGQELASRQFRRYARELVRRDPYRNTITADRGAVAHARSVLGKATSDLRIYQAIIEEASDSNPGIEFNREYRAVAAGALSAPHVVRGAYTRSGYAHVERALRNVDQYLNVEPWVLETRAASSGEKTALQRRLKQRYDSQFVETWKTFVRSASVAGMSVPSAGQTLGSLASTQGPIIQLFALVNEHTSVLDSALVRRNFEPIRRLGPARLREPTPATIGPFLEQLIALSSQMRTIAGKPLAERSPEITKALDMVTQLAVARGQVTRDVGSLAGDLRVDQLLKSPEDNLRRILESDLGRAADAGARGPIIEAGGLLCESYRAIAQKRPFSDEASVWASPTDVAAFFGPSGAFHNAVQGALGGLFTLQTSRITVKPGPVQPDQAAIEFMRRLASINWALYPGSSEPELRFAITPLVTRSPVSLTFEDQTFAFDPQRTQVQQRRVVTWQLNTDRSIFVGNRDEGRQVPDAGPWTPLVFFAGGEGWRPKGTNVWQFDYESTSMSFEVEMEPEVYAVVRRIAFQTPLSCPPRWIR